MKNPMTLQEQQQALSDNAAGYDMQQRRIIHSGAPWLDRHPDLAGCPLDFSTNEYRRKPDESNLAYCTSEPFGSTPENFEPITDKLEKRLKTNVRFDCPCCGKGIHIEIDTDNRK